MFQCKLTVFIHTPIDRDWETVNKPSINIMGSFVDILEDVIADSSYLGVHEANGAYFNGYVTTIDDELYYYVVERYKASMDAKEFLLYCYKVEEIANIIQARKEYSPVELAKELQIHLLIKTNNLREKENGKTH